MAKPEPSNSAAFILSHGRADKVTTWQMLKRSGWTRPVYIICDNEDETVDQYRHQFGDHNVIVFDKKAIASTFDTADTQQDRRTIVYARNACWQIAQDLGLDYHWQLDDDYKDFEYRTPKDGKLLTDTIGNLDAIFDCMVEFLETSGAATVALAQGGDHIGGVAGQIHNKLKRKAMNSFVLATHKPFQFLGRINEDVNTYVLQGSRGQLFFTFLDIMLVQATTQTSQGGMTDVYLDSGTYLKSFYTVMMHPSSVTIRTMGHTHHRLHHNIKWNNTVPKILSSRHTKA